jgi:hypothetical protein
MVDSDNVLITAFDDHCNHFMVKFDIANQKFEFLNINGVTCPKNIKKIFDKLWFINQPQNTIAFNIITQKSYIFESSFDFLEQVSGKLYAIKDQNIYSFNSSYSHQIWEAI